MEEPPLKFSVESGSDYYKKSKNSIRIALRRGYLTGYKDTNGWWWFYKNDSDEYYYGPLFPIYGRFSCLLLCFGISRYRASVAREEGKFLSKKYRRDWCINLYGWTGFMISVGMIDVNITQSASLSCVTKKDIWVEKAVDICRIASANQRVLIYLGWRGRLWACYANRSMIHLIKLEIPRGDDVGILVFGNGADDIMNQVQHQIAH